jgi:hypothetical protein
VSYFSRTFVRETVNFVWRKFMKKLMIAATIVFILVTGVAFGGECIGGDKLAAASGLNPQPLPSGRHHRRRRHRRHPRY